MHKDKVIIIGGGVSGLSCAQRLIDSRKFDVKLLEADKRIGGRVDSRKLGDHFVENGAQWVHGQEGNKVFETFNSVKLFDTSEECQFKCHSRHMYVTSKGRFLENEVHDRIGEIVWKIVDGCERNEIEGSFGEWAEKTFHQEVEQSPIDVTDTQGTLNAPLLDFIHRYKKDYDGADNWYQCSLKGHHEYWECQGNLSIAWKPPACYSSLLGLILHDDPTLAPGTLQPDYPNWIETEKHVVKIEMLPSTEPEPLRVTCSDNTQYTGHHLVCTVSLGVLKHYHENLFHPPLPSKKVLAIENLGIGCIDKLHFDFKKAWWPKTVSIFNFLWEDCDQAQEYWHSDVDDSTLMKEVDGFPLWCRNILGFYTVASHPTALLSWISGPTARFIEKMPDEYVKNMYINVCRKFLKNYDIPDPVEFCRSSWFGNPYTKGSYSFRQMDSEKFDVVAADLAAPILNEQGNPVICFAGEATHDHYYSTVHGAYESGQREAERLINLQLAIA